MASKSNKNDIREYFYSLNTSQKKLFILNFKKKVNDISSGKYNEMLSEFIKAYNKEVKEAKEAKEVRSNNDNEEKKDTPAEQQPEISEESFAIAFASMLAGLTDGSLPVEKPKILGTWQREFEGQTFYYKFNEDGTFETNDTPDNGLLKGSYTLGLGGSILMERHHVLKISSIMLSVSGSGLSISLTDGQNYDYKRIE